jgi:hypothetical protein
MFCGVDAENYGGGDYLFAVLPIFTIASFLPFLS